MRAGFEKVFVITRPVMQDQIRLQLEKWMHPNRFEILLQEQTRPKPWGTAHALHFLAGHWDGPFLVLNADDYYGKAIAERCMNLLRNNVQAAALVYELAPTLSPYGPVARGLCQVEGSKLLGIEEVLRIQQVGEYIQDEQQRILDPDALISMNAWLLPNSFLPLLIEKVQEFLTEHAHNETAEVYLPKVIHALIQEVKIELNISVMPAEWFGITYAADMEQAQEQILRLESSQYASDFTQWI